MPEKTRLIEFGRVSLEKPETARSGKARNLYFPGVHASLRRATRQWYFHVWRETAEKRMRAKLQQIKQELRAGCTSRFSQWAVAQRVVLGYYQYHAVPGNLWPFGRFRRRLVAYGGMYCAAEAKVAGDLGEVEPASSTGGFLHHVLCILTRRCVSTPRIQGRSRMR